MQSKLEFSSEKNHIGCFEKNKILYPMRYEPTNLKIFPSLTSNQKERNHYFVLLKILVDHHSV